MSGREETAGRIKNKTVQQKNGTEEATNQDKLYGKKAADVSSRQKRTSQGELVKRLPGRSPFEQVRMTVSVGDDLQLNLHVTVPNVTVLAARNFHCAALETHFLIMPAVCMVPFPTQRAVSPTGPSV